MQHRIDEATKRYEHLSKEASWVKIMLIMVSIAYVIIAVKAFILLSRFLLGGVTFGI